MSFGRMTWPRCSQAVNCLCILIYMNISLRYYSHEWICRHSSGTLWLRQVQLLLAITERHCVPPEQGPSLLWHRLQGRGHSRLLHLSAAAQRQKKVAARYFQGQGEYHWWSACRLASCFRTHAKAMCLGRLKIREKLSQRTFFLWEFWVLTSSSFSSMYIWTPSFHTCILAHSLIHMHAQPLMASAPVLRMHLSLWEIISPLISVRGNISVFCVNKLTLEYCFLVSVACFSSWSVYMVMGSEKAHADTHN